MVEDTQSSFLDTLPNELIHQIVSYCPATTVLVLLRTCWRLNQLVDNRIWLQLCRQEFRYWSPEHDFRTFSDGDISRVNWRSIFLKRRRKQQETTELLDSILESQSGRIDKFQQIVDLGYDAKDCLLRHLDVNDHAEDWLARRWYSNAVLGCLHRSIAIKEWSKIHRGGEQSLERALGAFDMFVLHDQQGDFDEIKCQLDAIAKSIVSEEPDFNSNTTRQKALIIAAYLTRHRLIGIRGPPEYNYHNLQNNFIGFALHDSDHSSLPLQTAAIYCSVARRLGVQASPCAVPFHVFVIVRIPAELDLDGDASSLESDNQNMYLDPFETDQEIDVSVLIQRLQSVGTSKKHYDLYLGPELVTNLILRTHTNIITSIQDSNRSNALRRAGITSDSSVITDLEGAFYGALWAALIFAVPHSTHVPFDPISTRRAYLPPFIEHFEANFSMDTALIERYLIPIFQHLPECAQLRESVRILRLVDARPKAIKARTEHVAERVQYKVGQVFRHRRYHYTAVITGWDIECSMSEQWIEQMGVRELQRGKHQSFYHVLAEDKSVRYVAEENIVEIRHPMEPESLMPLAGKYFKRWDRHLRRFVSNIKDEYPDD